MSVVDYIDKAIAPIRRKIMSMVACALIKELNDSSSLQTAKISLLGTDLLNIERIQEFGFTSTPVDGSEAVVLFSSGDKAHGIIIATDSSKYRIKLEEKGAVALYNSNGDCIKLLKDKIEVIANHVSIGGTSGKKLITEDILDALQLHTHAASGAVTLTQFNTTLHATQKTEAI